MYKKEPWHKQEQFKSWAIVYDLGSDRKASSKRVEATIKVWKTVPSIWARFNPDGYQLLMEHLPSLIMRETANIKNYRIEPSFYDLDEQEGKPPVKNNYRTT